ncbi:hypothetical protein GCM10010124_29370 [Pilimelia terevasa]|uniref:Haemophore haem-binding domain-containing protein n=1 Tax=Pilimelia terevasa TaxID=53372 RepID=A0A8J3FJ34_9ACTN|nr:hypothetical protein [Pilimelia terevasa]GGK34835.1 hypothetical protein GCM10010124_29370 [Pilimelia terevasa]
MRPRTLIVAAGALLLAAGAGTAAALTLDDDAPPAAVDVESRFVAATAAHLCRVQSTVYSDPGAMASAYARPPDYPDVPADQVAALRGRLKSDPALADRLAAELKATCHPGGASPTPSL